MQIRQVEYRQLRSFSNHSNETVGAVAAVGEGEDPDAALAALRAWVGERLGSAEEQAGLADQLWRLRSDLGEINRLLEYGRREYGRLRAILAAHGIELPEYRAAAEERDDIPF